MPWLAMKLRCPLTFQNGVGFPPAVGAIARYQSGTQCAMSFIRLSTTWRKRIGVPWTSMMVVVFELLRCGSSCAWSSRYVDAMLSRAELRSKPGIASKLMESGRERSVAPRRCSRVWCKYQLQRVRRWTGWSRHALAIRGHRRRRHSSTLGRREISSTSSYLRSERRECRCESRHAWHAYLCNAHRYDRVCEQYIERGKSSKASWSLTHWWHRASDA